LVAIGLSALRSSNNPAPEAQLSGQSIITTVSGSLFQYFGPVSLPPLGQPRASVERFGVLIPLDFFQHETARFGCEIVVSQAHWNLRLLHLSEQPEVSRESAQALGFAKCTIPGGAAVDKTQKNVKQNVKQLQLDIIILLKSLVFYRTHGGGSSLLCTALRVDFPVIRELTGKISQFWAVGPLETPIKLVDSGS
jgi:hypothetical protein